MTSSEGLNLALKQKIEMISQAEVNLLQFFKDSVAEIKNRPPQEGWPWKKSKKVLFPKQLEFQWRAEGSLFSAIALLEFYHLQHEKGEIEPDFYHRQLKSLLLEALQLIIRLEKEKTFNFEEFVKREKIAEYFPHGLEKVKLAEGTSDLDELIEGKSRINYQELATLPTKAADYVANVIELIDLLRLKAIATVDRILPLLDELRGILKHSEAIFGDDYWVIAEIDQWRKRLEKEKPGKLLSDKDLEKLELQAIRWNNDFRRQLKNL